MFRRARRYRGRAAALRGPPFFGVRAQPVAKIMFGKDSRQARIDTLIGRTAALQGDLQFAGGLHLDGRITGSVTARPGTDSSLSISETGAVEGAVTVPNVMLNGSVKGDIYAPERLVLGATARVHGNVYYGVIEMTLGAEIMGKLTQVVPEAGKLAAPDLTPPPPAAVSAVVAATAIVARAGAAKRG